MKRAIALFALVMIAVITGCERGETITSPASEPVADSTPPEQAAAQTDSTPPASPPPPSPAPPPMPTEQAAPELRETDEVAVISTTKGDMVIGFWPDVAPNTVENFKKLASEGFYNGTAFHRIMKGFMIQGGDPNTNDPTLKDQYGQGNPGYTIDAEFNSRKHVRGVISMARSAHPNSAGSQFFICLGPAPFLDGQYTGFGKLVKGDDVLGTIGNTPVSASKTGEMSVPNERVEVTSIKIVPYGQVM